MRQQRKVLKRRERRHEPGRTPTLSLLGDRSRKADTSLQAASEILGLDSSWAVDRNDNREVSFGSFLGLIVFLL